MLTNCIMKKKIYGPNKTNYLKSRLTVFMSHFRVHLKNEAACSIRMINAAFQRQLKSLDKRHFREKRKIFDHFPVNKPNKQRS